MSAREAAALVEHEQAIEGAITCFLQVGFALAEIRDLKVYRATHPTFAHYVRQRWGLARAHAYRQIQAAQIARLLSPTGDTKPPSESVLRELAPLRQDSSKVAQAWNEARVRYGETPSANQVRQVVAQIGGPPVRVRRHRESGARRLAASAVATSQLLAELGPIEVTAMTPAMRTMLAQDLRSLAVPLLRLIKCLERGSQHDPSI